MGAGACVTIHVNTYYISLLPLQFFSQSQVTALMIASYHGSVEAVKELLSSGAAVDMQDEVHHFWLGTTTSN